MDTRKRFTNPLDEAIDAVRFDAPREADVQSSKARVWAQLQQAAQAEASHVVAGIHGCEDFRALFPAYRAGKLPEARELLVQDHLRECGACRRAYDSGARSNVLAWTQPKPRASQPASFTRRYAFAATLLATVATAAWLFRDQFLPAGTEPRATLASATGPVYLINAQGQTPLKTGQPVKEKEWLRTASGAKAMVRLEDGSMVEMNERTEMAVARNRADTTIFLDRGAVIVQAAKQRDGHLIVQTDDSSVYVTGTVFSVTRGVLGSRVSVAEGSVAVKQQRGDRNAVLKPGEQYVATRYVAAEPVENDFRWSANADDHLALLNEFAKVKNAWQKLQLPELRYDSALLRQMPAGTVFFAGLPNLGGALEQAWRAFESQTQQSPVLRDWWTRQETRQEGKSAAEVVAIIRTFHEYLGSEVVFAAVPDANGKAHLAFLAEVTRSGLAGYIKTQTPAGAQPPPHAIVNNLIVISEGDSLKFWSDWAARRSDAGFANSGLGQRLLASYREGTGMIAGVDMQAMHLSNSGRPDPTGFSDMRYFVIEHRTLQQRNDLDSEVKAAVSFSAPRRGLVSLLAAPGPAGSLDFFSPRAAVAASLVAARPEAVYDEFMSLARQGNLGFVQEIEELEERTGMSVRNDIAQALGQDATFGLDGQLLPIPAWKAVFEVRDPNRLQLFMERLVAELNTELTSKGRKGVQITREDWDGRTLHTVQWLEKPMSFSYVFTDGFWVLAPDKNALTRAMRAKTGGWRLANSSEFRQRLPQAPTPHYSGMVYVNLTDVTDLIGEAAGTLVPGQRIEQLNSLAINIKPALICLYAGSDNVRMQTRTGLLGLTMEQWLGASGLHEILNSSPVKILNHAGGPKTAVRVEQRTVVARTQ